MTDYADITWNGQTSLFGTTDEIEDHPITTDVTQLYFDSPNTNLETGGNAQEVVRDETILLPNLLVAAATFGEGHVVAIADSNVLDDGNLNESENLLLGINIFQWINNRVPVAVIETPLPGLFPVGQHLTFDGTESYDPEGKDLTYRWVSDMDGEFGTQASFDHALERRGPHVITLFVSDGFKTADTSVDIILNTPPVARIIAPAPGRLAVPGSGVDFAADTGADEDGDEVGYLWESSMDGELSRSAEFTLSNLSLGEHIIYLTVTDTYGAGDMTSTMLTINTPPMFSIQYPKHKRTYQVQDQILFRPGSVHDGDDDVLSYRWASSRDGELGQEEEFWKKLSAGEHVISLQVEDGYQTVEGQVTIYMNSPPTAVIDSPGEYGMFLTTELISFDASGSHDTDLDDIDYSWESDIDGELGQESEFVKWLSPGEHTLTLTVDDNRGGFDLEEVHIVVNTPPLAGIDSPLVGVVYQTAGEILFDASSSFDPEDELTFTWRSDMDGVLGKQQVFTDYLSAGEHTITLEVDDGRNGRDSDEVTIRVNTQPRAFINHPEDGSMFLTDEEVVFDASSSDDPDGDALIYSWKSDVDGGLGNGKIFTGELSAGRHVVTLTVYDEWGGSDQTEVEIELDTPPEVILLKPSYGKSIGDGSVILSWAGEDPDGDPLTYDIYLDTDDAPKRITASGHSDDSLEVENLERGRTYYWKVVASDGYAEGESEIWMFKLEEEEDDEGFEIGDMTSSMVLVPSLVLLGALVLVAVSRIRKREDDYSGEYDRYDSGRKSCPSCGSRTQYSEDENDYYCWECEEYLDDL